MQSYSWKTKFFSSKTTLYQGDTAIGFFTLGIFMKGHLELLGKTYIIKSIGIWCNTYEIYEEGKAPIAKLTFRNWGVSTKIEYENKVYEMKYNSIFLTHFNIYHQGKNVYTYKASSYKGRLSTDKEDSLLIALGVYCHVKRIMNN